MTPQYRCVRIDRCFDCPRCKENPHGYSILKIWMCQQGYEPGRPLPAPGGDNGIPDWCPLPVHSDFQSEREIPNILFCQSLPNDHGFCGKNDCFCKELERVESGDICKWMQENRKREGKGGELE